MASSTQHYATHLAPIYEWMVGGLEPAVTRAAAELDALELLHRAPLQVVDLGAGLGAHTLALARAGHTVLAIDTSALLLERLQQAALGLPVNAVAADLREFQQYLDDSADLILCMGDTLTHLPEYSDVEKLIGDIGNALGPRGTFIATFRDYSHNLSGAQRFIPVKSDAQRILTCFLEYTPECVVVHDLLYERQAEHWNMQVSAYRKLRLASDTIGKLLQAQSLDVRQESGPSGMVRLIAGRPA